MKIFKSLRLLTKTTLFYLIFIMITFFVSAQYLINKANDYVDRETEDIYNFRERHLIRHLSEHDSIKDFRTTKVSLLENLSDTTYYPQYKDTLIYIEDLEDYKLHREKILTINVKEKVYLVNMLVNIDDFTKLEKDIASRIVPSFIVLAILIIIFSAFLSGYLLKPFHRILAQMNKYKVGRGVEVNHVKSSTVEFRKLQNLFNSMVDRTESDYKKLKEYTENMAHEIQTPLTIIRNKTERLISDEDVMSNHKDTVKVIYNETNHLSKLGTTLNLLTKIENGEYTNKLNLSTKDIILKHVDSIAELVELKSLKIETDLKDDHHILIDPFLFDIIMKNLLRNAVRYATNQGPITIKTEDNSLSISNFGDELKGDQNKIFERFFTSDHSNQSLGLGLSLVKRICDLNQLQISYEYMQDQHVFRIKC